MSAMIIHVLLLALSQSKVCESSRQQLRAASPATFAFPGRPLTKATTAKLVRQTSVCRLSTQISDKLKLVELRALRFFLRAHLIHDHREIARHRLNHGHQSLRLRVDKEQHLGN